MARQDQVQYFLANELGQPELSVSPQAADALRDFDLSLLDRLPSAERREVVSVFLEPMQPIARGAMRETPDSVPYPGIEPQDMQNAAASLKRYLDARGIDSMSPQAQAVFKSCDCWPF